jgi:hypothetical protein
VCVCFALRQGNSHVNSSDAGALARFIPPPHEGGNWLGGGEECFIQMYSTRSQFKSRFYHDLSLKLDQSPGFCSYFEYRSRIYIFCTSLISVSGVIQFCYRSVHTVYALVIRNLDSTVHSLLHVYARWLHESLVRNSVIKSVGVPR